MTTNSSNANSDATNVLPVQSRGRQFHLANKSFRDSNHVSSTSSATPTQTSLDSQLLQLLGMATSLEQESFDEHVRKLAILHGHGVGAAHLIADESRNWTLERVRHTGFHPETIWTVVEQACIATGQQDTIHLHVLDVTRKLMGIFVPRTRTDGRREVFLLLIPQSKQHEGLATVKALLPAIEAGNASLNTRDTKWQLRTLAQVVELLERCSGEIPIGSKCNSIANELNLLFGSQLCSIVLFSTSSNSLKPMLLATNSGSSEASVLPTSEKLDDILQVALDASSQHSSSQSAVYMKDGGSWSTVCGRTDSPIHQQLAQSSGNNCVISCPLVTQSDESIGAIVVAGDASPLIQLQVSRWLDCAASPIANGLSLAVQAEKGKLQRRLERLGTWSRSRSGIFSALLLIGFVGLMFVPVTYRVRAKCVVEPTSRRFAAAPFEDFIVSGFVSPGDIVQNGQLLATMEGDRTRSEISELEAKRDQTARRRDIELADRNVSKLFLEELEYRKIEARLAVLEYRRGHLEIRSPISGTVLSGSLERAEAAAVKTGQVLYEVGPANKMKLEVAIPANEISHVEINSTVTVWINGQESNSIEGTIHRIHPQSQIRHSKSVFVAEVEVENSDNRLRPGMSGYAKVHCSTKPLGWTLFHKPYNSVRTIMSGW